MKFIIIRLFLNLFFVIFLSLESAILSNVSSFLRNPFVFADENRTFMGSGVIGGSVCKVFWKEGKVFLDLTRK